MLNKIYFQSEADFIRWDRGITMILINITVIIPEDK